MMNYAIYGLMNFLMNKVILILIFSMLFSLCSNEIEEDTASLVTSTTTTIAATTTTTTLLPSQERAKEINIDRSPRRGVIRTSPSRYISTIYKYDAYFSNKVFNPNHEYIEEFTYNINYPEFIDDVACRKIIDDEIMKMINSQVEYKKSVLDVLTLTKLRKMDLFGEILNVL